MPHHTRQGFIHVYTGDGKGKTTAALGLALRALGRGLKVLMIQFMKGKEYGEHIAARKLAPDLRIEMVGKPYFLAREGDLDEEALSAFGKAEIWTFKPGEPPPEYRQLTLQGLARARQALVSAEYDVIILDEVNVAVYYELLTPDELLALLDLKPPGIELVLTGRNAIPEVMRRADLVTEMVDIKHYFKRGITSRRGFEE